MLHGTRIIRESPSRYNSTSLHAAPVSMTPTTVADFDYHLPAGLIAQMPRWCSGNATRGCVCFLSKNGFRDVPIIALTGNATSQDRQVCIDAGMNDVLAKPFDARALYEILARWLSKPKA